MSLNRLRFPLMLLGMLSLAAGLWTGISRLGWEIHELREGLLALHGPLMICGFLGTVIGLERAVALERPWTYIAPFLSGTGSFLIVLTEHEALGRLLITAGSLFFMIVFIAILRKQFAAFTVTMAIGALLWLIGNIFWLAGYPVYLVVFWWAGYLILTIAGERLDLSRLLSPSKSSYTIFFASVAVFLFGVVISMFLPETGIRLIGFGIAALTIWLVMHDIATKTVRMQGLTRFTAVCLLSGYFWLGVSGLFAIFTGSLIGGTPVYDATLHALFLGFVLAMIFGHAPIIFPAVLQVPIIYTPLFYLHLVLLELSLIVRVAGDLSGVVSAVKWGGLINVAALVLFLASTATAGIRGLISQRG